MEKLLNKNSIDDCIDSFLRGFTPPKTMTVTKFAGEKRVLPKVSSDQAGRWDNERTPYLKELMNVLSPDDPTEIVCLMKGSQIGGSEVVVNWVLSSMYNNPGPMLIVQPTVDLAKVWSTQRLRPSIDMIPEIKAKIQESKLKKGTNAQLQKDYTGGTIMLGGANSAKTLCSRPIGLLGLEECDRYPPSADGEGAPDELAIKRTTNFANRKIYYNSTPVIKGASVIENVFLRSDQRWYYVPCPSCGEKQIILWPNIRWEKRKPETVYLECTKCSERIKEYNKTKMLAEGEWRKHNEGSKIAGFHLSGLYSPLGWYSWENAVEDHLKALGDPQKRKVFVNTVLGETFNTTMESISPSWLFKRKEKYESDVPVDAVLLTAGVDIQKDRIECTTWGWGAKNEAYVISHDIWSGDTELNDVWDLLDLHLQKTFYSANGNQHNIACTAVDSGYLSVRVYEFCKARQYRRVYAIKGFEGQGKPAIGKASNRNRVGCRLYPLGIDSIKQTIYSNLKVETPGAGYIHFPENLTEEYFRQLTVETHEPRKTKIGLPKMVWTLPPGRRNETFDCAVYAHAAKMILNVNIDNLVKENVSLKINLKPPARKGRRVRSKGVA